MPHVVCWSNNVSAVQWINRLQSKNPFSQEINRSIGLSKAFQHSSICTAKAVFNIRLSARHLPVSSNRMADAGSRASREPYLSMWINLSRAWRQVPVPEHWRRIYKAFSTICNPTRWPRRHGNATRPPGNNGVDGAPICTTAIGYQANQHDLLANSCCSSFSAISMDRPVETRYKPSCLKSVRLRGIIGARN
ncbi:unnamed protein product [Phytophthora lilii]|uniref:Unnamed protein product n=1 Tax=Phytophthora lilii TaxID=2077276 RepID=A0A9W6X5M7_9STRA|nr:unnamed protein product [Phytophthora lilii]